MSEHTPTIDAADPGLALLDECVRLGEWCLGQYGHQMPVSSRAERKKLLREARLYLQGRGPARTGPPLAIRLYPENYSELVAHLQQQPGLLSRCSWDAEIDGRRLTYEAHNSAGLWCLKDDGNHAFVPLNCSAGNPGVTWSPEGFTIEMDGHSIDYLYQAREVA